MILLCGLPPALTQWLRAQRPEFTPVGSAAELAERLNADPLAVEAVVLGDGEEPQARSAQRVHAHDPFIAVLLTGAETRRETVVQAVQFTPFIGSDVRWVTEDAERVCAEALDAAQRTRARRAHHRTVAGLHVDLNVPALPAPQFLDQLLEQAPIGVAVLDAHGRWLSWNAQTERILGVTGAALTGGTVWGVLTADHDRLGSHLARVTDSGAPSVEVYGRRDVLEVSVKLSQLDGQGNSRVLALLEDVTEQRRALRARDRAEAELRAFQASLEQLVAERTEELLRSNRELEQFAYVASHDLQAPLRSVMSFTQLLERHLDGQLDERGRGFVTHIQGGAMRMKALVDDLLVFARAGRTEQQFTQVELGNVLEQALLNLHELTESVQARVTCGPLPVVRGNAGSLVQLLQNLIANALTYRRPGVTPEVRIDATRDGNGWHLRVQDNGIGIDKQYHEKIFLVFQRLHRFDEVEGTGIGLAVCKRIVERHGGRLWVESTVGEGSVFHVTLPAPAPEGPAAAAGPPLAS